MSYSIKQIADMMGVTTSTLRYYDQEGLLPEVKRVNGIRVFEDKDFQWLRVLNCLKNTNMPIKEIREYIRLYLEGDSTIEERRRIVYERRAAIDAQLEGKGYSFVEVLAPCPSNWKMAPVDCYDRIENVMMNYFPCGELKG